MARPLKKIEVENLSVVDFGLDYSTPRKTERSLNRALLDTPKAYHTHPGLHRQPLQDISAPLKKFRTTDALCFLYGFLLAWFAAGMINSLFLERSLDLLGPARMASHFGQYALLAMATLVWFEHTGHYRIRMPFWLEAKKILSTIGFVMLIDGFMLFAEKQDFSRSWVMTGWIIAGLGILITRSAQRFIQTKKGTWQVPTLVIGNGDTAKAAKEALEAEKSLGYTIIQQIKNPAEAFNEAGFSWRSLCAQKGAANIVVALDSHEIAGAELALAQLVREQVPFSILPPVKLNRFYDLTKRRYFINHDIIMASRPRSNGSLWQKIVRTSNKAGRAIRKTNLFQATIAVL